MPRPNDLRKELSLRQLKQLLAVVVEDGVIPSKFTEEVLRSQAKTYGLTVDELRIQGTSLNTAKRIANRLFADGFAGLDLLRQQALHALEDARAKTNAKPPTRRERLQQRIQEVETENELIKADLVHLTEAFHFALSCMRKYSGYISDGASRAAYRDDELELFARAGLTRSRPTLPEPSFILVKRGPDDA